MLRGGKFGGRGVIEGEFLHTMQELGAVANPDWTRYGIYDPLAGDLLESYRDWLAPDGKIVGRMEQYYWHGEQHYLYVVL
mgnify:CR=1 FL=1